jgi:adenosylcobinamide-GDP ribazoletransferase
MLNDLRTAFAFLTILPVQYPENAEPGRAFAVFPLVGLVIGVLVSLVASSTIFAPDLTAFLALVTWVMLTGGLHLDGFGDSCDALLATTTPERRLEILKDPRAGTWAVLGLVLLLLGKWLTLRTLAPVFLIAPPIVGRCAMVIAAYVFPYARSSGLGAYFRQGLGRAQLITATGTTVISVVIVSLYTKGFILFTLIIGVAVALGMGRWAAGRLNGGLTGDVYGAICELTELVCLIFLSGTWTNV